MKILKISAFVLLVIILIILGQYYYDKSFEGNENIHLISQGERIKTLEELIAKEDFKNNALYIDIWGTSCKPCINEFKYAVNLKERYKNKPIKFIYLSSPYGHFDDEQKWKNMIRKYNLAGYHLLMSMDFYYNIWKIEGIKDSFVIPHYILIDKEGKINKINAARPSEGEELYKQIDALL